MKMRIRNITWQFFLVCFTIVTVSLWFTTWYSVRVYKQEYLQTTIKDVTTQSFLLKREISKLISDSSGNNALDSICKLIGNTIQTRITVVNRSGRVIGDSQADPDSMENHANRPEVMQAITGVNGMEQRFSATLQQNMLYVAEPISVGDSTKAILRLAVSLKAIRDHEREFYLRLVLASVLTLVLLAIASYLIARRLSKPIREMKSGAQRFAAGDLNFKLVIPPGDELGGLAQSLNAMAATLDERIKIITHQRNELNAILNSMAEGVIAVDSHEHIISINPAAARILGVSDVSANDKWLHEIVRNSNLQRFLVHTLSADTTIETTFVLPGPDGEQHIQASGTVLNEGIKGPEGAVLVLNDITRLKRYENIRKEFVANVSHELRTPLTSIKGFVETIRTGDYELAEEVKEYLQIIGKKTELLCSIVDDILTLSSIERDHEYREINLSDSDLNTVLDDAVKTCTAKAKLKNIAIDLSCDNGLKAKINPLLIEQAVVNLIDNAIKYSDIGKNVFVSASLVDQEFNIVVEDQGIGIPEVHLTRVFERFYRVDKARSRKLGGTGLGLSIVKNIVIAHNGRVTVESKPGKGSTFRIQIPVVKGE
jgi:two-component system phosphate regulon sensor histidine kinase PhoR